MLDALRWVHTQGWTEVKIYTDCKLVVDACNSPSDSYFVIQPVILDILDLVKSSFIFTVICKVDKAAVAPAHNSAVTYLRNLI